jgi:hypothetical protein
MSGFHVPRSGCRISVTDFPNSFILLGLNPNTNTSHGEVDAALEATVYFDPKTHGYYRNKNGRIIGSSPWEYLEYWRRTRTPDLAWDKLGR